MKTAVRYVLAFVGVFGVLQPIPVLLTPPDPFDLLVVSVIVAVVSLLVVVVFIRQSSSLRRLYGFLLGMYVVTFVVLVVTALVAIGTSTSMPNDYSVEGLGFQVLMVLVAYVVSFHLVYRGGYARFKAWFA